MTTIDVYGLGSCDNTKKALNEFKKNHVRVEFHDFKIASATEEKLAYWCKELGWEKVLNKKSTTWRSLSAEVQASIVDQATAVQLMLQYNSLVKRPVIEMNQRVTVGLSENIFPNIKK